MNNALAHEHHDFLEKLERPAFDYFIETVNPSNGLIPDTSRKNAPCSIAVTGFGLTAYTIGVQRGWLAREQAVSLTLAALRFFWNSPTGEGGGVTGYQGFYYHFLDMQSGQRVWDCELSMIDTALLMAGILAAATFFSASSRDETEIREISEKLYRRVNWAWASNGGVTLSQGWKPDCGFLHYGWEGYNEGTILYLLALASPTYPIDRNSYKNWAVTYQWENIYGRDVLYAGPLFIHQFSHGWVDFRLIQDAFMREKNSDYFENSRQATYLQRDYGRLNPLRFQDYSEDCWGLSAGEGPSDRSVTVAQRERPCFGYAARGVPFGPDDGTLAPPAVAASIAFAPEIAIPALKHILENYPYILNNGRLSTGFNPSLLESDGKAWVSPDAFGLDQGIVLMMIENFRSDFVWNLMKGCPHLREGLKRADFRNGWLA